MPNLCILIHNPLRRLLMSLYNPASPLTKQGPHKRLNKPKGLHYSLTQDDATQATLNLLLETHRIPLISTAFYRGKMRSQLHW